MRISMVAIALAFLAISWAGAADRYYNRGEEFSIDAPTGWEVKKSPHPNTIVKFVYRDNVDRIAVLSIAAYEESGLDSISPLTADRMYDRIKREFRDFTVSRLASGTSRIRSMEAVWNLIKITETPQARIIGKHYHFRRNGKLWRISAQTDSGKEFFATILPAMEKSISTFAFGL
jgi:hypothetical protein